MDFEVLSLHCHECRKHQHDDKSSQVSNNGKKNIQKHVKLIMRGLLVVWKVMVHLKYSKDLYLKEI